MESIQINRQNYGLTVDQLLKQRQALLREIIEVPPDNPDTELIYHYRELIYDVKIECERARQDLRTQIAMCRKRVIITRKDDLEIEESKTWFNWEPLRDAWLSGINEKERKAVAYYTDLINKLRNAKETVPGG